MLHNYFRRIAISVIVTGALTLTASAWADDDEERASAGFLEITVTNLTRGQQFTPILVASHRAGVRLFELGQPASPGLQIVAEEGDVAPLTAELLAMPGVLDVTNSGALLDPGASVKIRVRAHDRFNRVSVAAMLIPTNDTFFAVNGARVPHDQYQPQVLTSVAYDSGSERNDELCTSIPGPFFIECGGPGGGAAPAGDEEGYVHVHAGIHGVGDIKAAQRDWRNPVARITIRRVQ
ncbi:MAG: spondin domain-containing protein [Steroidobacteraceae bacterium]